jgi:hypothetical protein
VWCRRLLLILVSGVRDGLCWSWHLGLIQWGADGRTGGGGLQVYEAQQIGSDYMFRIDAFTVLDATRWVGAMDSISHYLSGPVVITPVLPRGPQERQPGAVCQPQVSSSGASGVLSR